MKSRTCHNHNIMWPVLLVVLAISYVICVLLLSGLQKEDLDANTLKKLERHNVNIYDMNNDSLREECLSEATRKDTNKLGAQQKYTPVNLLKEQNNNNSVAINNHKIQITFAQFMDKASLPDLSDGMLIKDGIKNNNAKFKNITDIENRYESTNVDQNVDADLNLNKESSLDIVLNIWNKLPRQITEVALPANKTKDLTRRQITPTAQHSKEIDYVGRIIADYLATLSASTIKKKLSIDFILQNLKYFLEQHEETKKEGPPQPFNVVNNKENILNNKKRNYMETFGSSILIPKGNYPTQKSIRIYSTPQASNLNNNEQIERHKNIQDIGHINTASRENLQNEEAFKYLDDIIRLSKQFNSDTQLPYLRKIIDNKISNEVIKQQISRFAETGNNIYKDLSKHETLTTNMKHSAGVINAQMENLTDIGHFGDIHTVNKESDQKAENLHYWHDILRTDEVPYSEKSKQYRNDNESARQKCQDDHVGTMSGENNNGQQEISKDIQYIHTVNKDINSKQAALQYLDNILRYSNKFNIEAQILNSDKKFHDRINYENDRQLSGNSILTYINDTQKNNGKDSSISEGNGLSIDYVGKIYGEVNNAQTETLKNKQYDSNTVNREDIQKQEALQYLDDILRFSKSFNTQIPYSEKSVQIKINNNDEHQQISRNNRLSIIPEVENSNNKNSIIIQSNATPSDPARLVSAKVIDEIAEKVKDVVITDLRKEISIKQDPTSPRNTVIATSSPDINTSIKDKLIMHQKETKENNDLGKTLLEILREYKTLKERNDSITTSMTNANIHDKENSVHSENFHQKNSPIIDGHNTYDLHSSIANIEQNKLNSYNPKLQAVSWDSQVKPPKTYQDIMQTNNYKSDYRLFPITIQTNFDQIPPLAIQVSNPMALPNQNIISSSVRVQQQPVIKQELSQNFADVLHISKDKNNHIYQPTNEDRIRNPNIMNKIVRDSFKNTKQSSDILTRIQKLQDRIKYVSEHKRQNENTDRPVNTEYQQNKIHGGNPNYYSSDQFSNLNHKTDSKHPNTYNWRFQHHNYPNRPSNKYHERHIFTNNEDNLGQSRNWHHSDNLNRQEDKTLNRPFLFKYLNTLNKPLISKHRQLFNEHSDSDPLKVEPKPRDVANHNILSQLMDSRHRDLLNGVVKSHPTERINRLTDYYSNSDLLKEYVRNEQHPKTSKYHEKLEQSENFSSNNYYDPYNKKISAQSNCDGIASRQQIPLSNRNQQRTRFDDTHFKNFLKSQQKVTAMLEKILAVKTKPELQSVEIV